VKKVIAYKFIAKDTVEEKILALQEKKQRIVQDIIAEDNSVFKYLDADEIMNLFS
jgi:SNF2 family DNA or RNA helicase